MLEQTLSEKASRKVVKAIIDGESDVAKTVYAEERDYEASHSFTREIN